jgi:hypothetical protein
LTQEGRYGAWARFWEAGASGEREGKKYGETRHCATLVFTAGSAAVLKPAATAIKLPQATASFGAVALDGWLYVYGGHVSPTHNYFIEAVSGSFDRLRLTGDPVWESLPWPPIPKGRSFAAFRSGVFPGGRPRQDPLRLEKRIQRRMESRGMNPSSWFKRSIHAGAIAVIVFVVVSTASGQSTSAVLN